IAQAFCAIADDLIALALMDGVGQSVRPQRSVFLYGAGGLGAIGRHTAGKDELPDLAARAVHDADGFHDPRRPGDVDLPHTFPVENSRLLRVEDEGEMNYRLRLRDAQDFNELTAGCLTAQVCLLKARQRGV